MTLEISQKRLISRIYDERYIQMPSLLPVSIKGKKYWRIVESRRVNGKPRPIPICYLGTVANILEVFSKSKEESSFKANAVPGPLKGQDEAIPAVLLEDEAEKRLDKALNWLRKSRESWKLKCQAAKSQLKTKTLAVKRLRELRNDLKSKSQQLKIEIDHLRDSLSESQNEVAQLKARLQVSEKELTEVKKK